MAPTIFNETGKPVKPVVRNESSFIVLATTVSVSVKVTFTLSLTGMSDAPISVLSLQAKKETQIQIAAAILKIFIATKLIFLAKV